MSQSSRRNAMKYAAGGMLALLGTSAAASASLVSPEQNRSQPPQDNKIKDNKAKATAEHQEPVTDQNVEQNVDHSADHKRVVAAGMTEQEAACWDAVGMAAGKFFELPELHPMDKQEVAQAIHIVQHKLLARPTYRKYLELARAEAGEQSGN